MDVSFDNQYSVLSHQHKMTINDHDSHNRQILDSDTCTHIHSNPHVLVRKNFFLQAFVDNIMTPSPHDLCFDKIFGILCSLKFMWMPQIFSS